MQVANRTMLDKIKSYIAEVVGIIVFLLCFSTISFASCYPSYATYDPNYGEPWLDWTCFYQTGTTCKVYVFPKEWYVCEQGTVIFKTYCKNLTIPYIAYSRGGLYVESYVNGQYATSFYQGTPLEGDASCVNDGLAYPAMYYPDPVNHPSWYQSICACPDGYIPYSFDGPSGGASGCIDTIENFRKMFLDCDSTCTIAQVSIEMPTIVPQKTAGNKTTNVIVTLSGPAPAGGCNVGLRVAPVEFSGGHNHDGARQNHMGSLNLTTIAFPEGASQSSAGYTYTSNEVGGYEKIIAESLDNSGNVISSASTTVTIKVEALSALTGTSNLLVSGGTTSHLSGTNNYGTSYSLGAIQYAVGQYASDYSIDSASDIYLAVIDMSLPMGGLFDISGNWQLPHKWHRAGTSVDFSHNYKDVSDNVIMVDIFDANGNLIQTTNAIDEDTLDNKFTEQKCVRFEKNIGKIHYECPK